MFRLIFFIALVVVITFIWLTVRYYTKKLDEHYKNDNTGTPAPKQTSESTEQKS